MFIRPYIHSEWTILPKTSFNNFPVEICTAPIMANRPNINDYFNEINIHVYISSIGNDV